MRKINKIVIHHSESDWGNANEIRDWHVNGNGWSDIGYHYVICNAYPTFACWDGFSPNESWDGKIEIGRDESIPGAHVKGHNSDSLGICLVGNGAFTGAQIMSLKKLIRALLVKHKGAQVFGHCDLDEKKPECPSLNIERLMRDIRVN